PATATRLNGFSVTSLPTVGFFARLLRRYPRANAVIEVGNLLATTPIPAMSGEVIPELRSPYRIRPNDFRKDGRAIYGTVLRHAVRDDELSNDEVADLRRLQRL